MSQLLDSYRWNAAAARLEAQGAILPNVRARAIDAAARWSELAEKLDWIAQQSRARTDATSQAREGLQ